MEEHENNYVIHTAYMALCIPGGPGKVCLRVLQEHSDVSWATGVTPLIGERLNSWAVLKARSTCCVNSPVP